MLAALLWLWSSLLSITLNEELAQAEGVEVGRVRFGFMLVMALAVAIGMKIVGILLIVSLLVMPAAAARQLARTPEQMAVLAALSARSRWSLGSAPRCVGHAGRPLDRARRGDVVRAGDGARPRLPFAQPRNGEGIACRPSGRDAVLNTARASECWPVPGRRRDSEISRATIELRRRLEALRRSRRGMKAVCALVPELNAMDAMSREALHYTRATPRRPRFRSLDAHTGELSGATNEQLE